MELGKEPARTVAEKRRYVAGTVQDTAHSVPVLSAQVPHRTIKLQYMEEWSPFNTTNDRRTTHQGTSHSKHCISRLTNKKSGIRRKVNLSIALKNQSETWHNNSKFCVSRDTLP